MSLIINEEGISSLRPGDIIKIEGSDCIHIICEYEDNKSYKYALEMPLGRFNSIEYLILNKKYANKKFKMLKSN